MPAERRHAQRGRRRWDLGPGVVQVLIAWGIAAPGIITALLLTR